MTTAWEFRFRFPVPMWKQFRGVAMVTGQSKLYIKDIVKDIDGNINWAVPAGVPLRC